MACEPCSARWCTLDPVAVVPAPTWSHAGHNTGGDAIAAPRRPQCAGPHDRVSARLPASTALPVPHHQLVGGDRLDGIRPSTTTAAARLLESSTDHYAVLRHRTCLGNVRRY